MPGDGLSMCFIDVYPNLLKEIVKSLKLVDEQKFSEFAVQLLQSPRIFVAEAGRTVLIMRCFAMRLMHLGFRCRSLEKSLQLH